MSKKPIGFLYIDFITNFARLTSNNFTKELDSLFSPNVKKIINSNVICHNRNQLMKQMQDVKETYGLHKIHLLESIASCDNTSNIIRWEITYTKDNTTEAIITILKYNEQDLIYEINEVFGDKEAYQWAP